MIFLLSFLLFSLESQAEYRVYQYSVKNLILNSSDQPNSHIKTSTLNPVTFVAYNGGHRQIQVDLLRTWMCPGHTGARKAICPSPYQAIKDEK